jgi:hypothetical protein
MPCRGVKKENCWEDHVLILTKPPDVTDPTKGRVLGIPEGFSPCFSRDSNWTPPKYKSEAIQLQKTHTTPALNYSAAWFVTGYTRGTRYIAIAEETYAILQGFVSTFLCTTLHTVYVPDMDCFLCCVFSVLYCSVTLRYSFILCFLCVLYCSFFLYFTVSACDRSAATLTDVFRAFSSVVTQLPGYNSQRRGTARTSPFFFLLLCMFRSLYSMCFCV